MKRMIKSASIADEEFNKHGNKILTKAKELLNAIEDAPEHVVEECDINDLYEVLIEDLPAISFAVKSHGSARQARNEDMW